MKTKKKRKCSLCGDPVQDPVRYHPLRLNGRWTIACKDCADEARRGKFGEENRHFYNHKQMNQED